MEGYNIGDTVPYKNTRGNIKLAKISSFETVDNGKTWFHGVDTVTGAKVWYPVHISKTLIPPNDLEEMSRAEIYIESNSAKISEHSHNYEAISKHNALTAIKIQKQEDEQFFRSFILSVSIRLATGEQVDLEKEFQERYNRI